MTVGHAKMRPVLLRIDTSLFTALIKGSVDLFENKIVS